MKKCWVLLSIASLLLTAPRAHSATMTDEEAVEVMRSVLRADRQAIVTKALQLTPAESDQFWPVYQQYRAEMDKVGDGLLRLTRNYASFYPDVPQEAARKMLRDLTRLEDRQAAIRAEYLKKIGRVLPASKTLRFAQVENRLDLALRTELASKIPLVPVEGELPASRSTGIAYSEGVPGGIVAETHELTATVTAVDRANRRLHLLSPEGFKQTVKVGPEVVNFDQIRAGDKLRIIATEELVVRMAPPDDTTDSARVTLISLAPRGAKPGGVVSEATLVTATIAAIDLQKRAATVRFEDGSTRTFPVRGDVDLARRKVGEKILIRVTESVALTVSKP